MKGNLHYYIALALMLTMTITEQATAQIEPYFGWFVKKEIHYKKIPQDILPKLIDRDKMGKYESLKTPKYFVEPGENEIRQGEGVVEVRQGNDIYSWPIALYSKNKYIVFYAQGIDPHSMFHTTIVHGMHLSTALANLNMLKIGEKTAPVSACFEEPTFNKSVLTIPEQYLFIKSKEDDSEYLFLSYLLSYPEVASVVYTQPKSVIVAGQLVEVNSGVNYDVRMSEVPGLSLFDINNMRVVPNTTLHLKGIKQPKLKYKGDKIYYYNVSDYDCLFPRDYTDGLQRSSLSVMSQGGNPIYMIKLSPSQIVVESQITPAEGDVVFDLQETSKYICYCGTNKKHGYVGYDNPVLIVIDKNTNKVVARYNGSVGTGRKDKFFNRKDRFFDKMYVLDDDHLFITYNDFRINESNYEIVSLSDIVLNHSVDKK